ncbi:MAG: sigma-70 family RNA polymerase sigma factor [Candidatus Hydrogenedentes bacterium]|nr:sigma-70 family RNA polymerase sigma factor [Candidatus Hydrogenedentota bacterium]
MSGILNWGIDARLVRSTLRGDKNAFGRLVERHLPAVEAVALSYTRNWAEAEDVSQDTFLKAYQSLDTLRERNKFGPWVTAIARNAGRRAAARSSREASLADVNAAVLSEPAPDIAKVELLELLHTHVVSLPEDQREVLLLHYYSGQSLREIAAMLGITRDAAAKRLQRARTALSDVVMKSMANTKRSPEHFRKRATAITTAVIASACSSWRAEAALAGTAPATLLTTILKPTIVASLLTATAFVGFFYYLGANTKTANGISPAPKAAAVPPERAPSVETAVRITLDPQFKPKVEPELTTIGPGSITATVITAKGEPAVGATVIAELINWPQFTPAPNTTFKKEAVVDEKGVARFQNLPLGLYGVVATQRQSMWGDDFELTANSNHADTAIQLQPARRLEGTVVTKAGAPVPHAFVYPHSSPFFTNIPWGAFAALRMETDEDGAFHRDASPVLELRYCIIAEGFAPTITGVIISGNGPQQFVLQNGGTVSGTVIDADSGAPMPGISLALEGEARLEPVSVETGPDGSFKSPISPAGLYNVALKEEGYTTDDTVKAEVDEDSVASNIQIKVRLGGTISGVVRDKITGDPIAGATVTASAESRPARSSSPTDASGDYVIFGLAKAQYGVQAEADGYFADGISTTVEAGGEVENADISLTPGALLRGRVLESDGHGATLAFVHQVTETGELVRWKLPIVGDGDGKFHVLLPQKTDPMWLKAYTPYGSSEIVGPVDVTLPETLNVTLYAEIERTAGIEGTVTNADGDPIPFAFLGVYLAGDAHISTVSGKQVWADQSGRFSVGSLHPGLYSISTAASGGIVIDVRDGHVERDVVVVSGNYSGPPIQGRVTDSSGKPLSDASVSVLSPSYAQLTTSPDGTFTVTRLSKGDYALEISHPNYSTQYVGAIAEGASSINVVLHDRASLDGQIHDAETDQPIPKFELAQFPANALFLEYRLRRLADPEGKFRLHRAESGKTVLWIRAEGYVSERIELEIAPGASKSVDVKLHPAGSVTGFVVNSAGEPVSGVEVVVLLPEDTNDFHVIRTNGEGAFALSGLPLEEIGIAATIGQQESTVKVLPTRNPAEPITITLPDN